MYSDARDRIRDGFGDFSYFYSFMSQPKFQLDTFRSCKISLSLHASIQSSCSSFALQGLENHRTFPII